MNVQSRWWTFCREPDPHWLDFTQPRIPIKHFPIWIVKNKVRCFAQLVSAYQIFVTTSDYVCKLKLKRHSELFGTSALILCKFIVDS